MTDFTERLQAAVADRYVIERHLGEGGMATVYLAHDVRHDRKVALKVLRPELAAVIGAERFLAEIKTTANLQHPNVLPLFDSGDADGQLFYVMPYVEGETLRDRIAREKQLPVDEVVRMGAEVADALDYAHRHGVVHRDIKPENILLHDGRALVADFGIALALSTAGGSRMTETGMSVGTPAYMSPEQAMGGHEVTAKSDVYALGATLYEALVGEPPFTGPTAQAIIARLVTEDPRPLVSQRKTIPPQLEAAVLKALERLPADRFSTAAELRDALEGRAAVARPAGTAAARQARDATRGSRRTIAIMGAGMLLLAGVALWGWLRPGPLPPPITRQAIVLGPTLPGMIAYYAAIAPDGSAIVYGDTVGGRKLWIKERGQLDARPLAGLPDMPGGVAPAPSFSPDGEWVVYSERGLMRVARAGGAPVVVSDTAASGGAAWLDDGTIVFVGRNGDRLFRISADGGPTIPVKTDSLGGLIGRIAPIPGADAVLLTVGGGTEGRREVALDLATGAVHTLMQGATAGWIVPGKYLVYSSADGGLYAAPFDPGKLAVAGPSVSVLSGIRAAGGLSGIVVGRDGTMLYAQGGATSEAGSEELVSVPRDGSTPQRLDTSWSALIARNGGLALSPDGSKLALSVLDRGSGQSDLTVLRLPDGPATRLTFQGTRNIRPAWSPDGRTILYVSSQGDANVGLVERNADGSGRPARVALAEKRPVWEGLWSPDRKWIVYRTDDAAAGNGDILAVHTEGDSIPVPLVATSAQETGPALSPDGRWLAYTSSSSGRMEVYVRPFPDAQNGLWQISSDGGTEPQWSHDGKELFYRNGAGEMIGVDVTESPGFSAGAHHRLFNAAGYAANYDSHFYAVTRDDRHFLMLRPVGTSGAAADSAARLVLVRNWLPELRAKLKR